MQRRRPVRGSVPLLVAAIGLAGPAVAQTAPQPVQAGLQAGLASSPPAQAAPQAPPAPSSQPQALQANAAPMTSVAGCDAGCVRANSEAAAQLCAPRVEAEAPTDFEWVSRPFAKIFQQAEAPEGASTLVRYRGDSIRFLSPQKEWVRVTYECGFDAGKRAVEYVRVRLGRLDKAAPGAQGQAQTQTQAQPQGRAQPAPQAAQARAPAPSAPAMAANQQVAAAAPAPKRIRPSEPSEIEIRQVDARTRTARP